MVSVLVGMSLVFGAIEVISWFEEPTVKEIRCNKENTYCREYVVKASEALDVEKVK